MGLDLDAGGADRLAASARRAADLVDVVVAEFGNRAGDVVVAAVKPPIRTGRLASTVRVVATDQGFAITAGGDQAPYAGIVHARYPYITDAFHDREAVVVDTAVAAAQRLLDTLEGD